jgi:hypothetical protein
MILLVKLLLAHLLGDFVLQTDKLVARKEVLKLKSPFLYAHALLHGLLAMLLVWEGSFWIWALFIALTHLLIDAAKLYLHTLGTRRLLFLADQLLHVAILVLVAIAVSGRAVDIRWLFADRHLVLYTALVFVTVPASIVIRIFISAWTPNTPSDSSLQNAGNWIGILERVLVFGFIVLNKWEAIGFLLAAKSVFRFGDLRDGNDRKLTEYIMIGTLMSFGIAIGTGLIYLGVMSRMP